MREYCIIIRDQIKYVFLDGTPSVEAVKIEGGNRNTGLEKGICLIQGTDTV